MFLNIGSLSNSADDFSPTLFIIEPKYKGKGIKRPYIF